MSRRGPRPFAKILQDLADEKHPPAKDDLRALSDLSGQQLAEFVAAWPRLPAARRLAIMTDLGELADENFELDIRAAARAALDDAHGAVRAAAIRNLWEDHGTDLIQPYLSALTDDPSPEARSAAATALGVFMYLGEMEELPEDQYRQIEDALLAVFAGPDSVEIRRRALESVGYSRRPEAAAAIARAYADGQELLRVSALLAMGRSLDRDRWRNTVLKDLHDVSPRVRFEACRAAGELQLGEAVTPLGELTRDVDREVQEMSVWALGEIGGEEARRLLERRARGARQSLAQAIEDALANAELMDGLVEFDLMDLRELEEDD